MMKTIGLTLLVGCIFLSGCGGTKTVKPTPPSASSKPVSTPSTNPASSSQTSSSGTTKPGGYYLDDGPGENPPQDIDSIPNATPKKEPLLERANKPYKALGATYTPMTNYQPYKLAGVASWYGKRYHGRKTSSGEVYDMYSMTAAHPTLPLPSYVKVSNPANGRSVIVRVNDRGPFKSSRIIDLSYAAAYKLRFTSQGSSLVEVEAIDPDKAATYAETTYSRATTSKTTTPVATTPEATIKPDSTNQAISQSVPISQTGAYFVQAGAFKNEVNADALMKKIQGLEISQNAGINSVYNNGLYRLKLGPFESKQEADLVASRIRKQLNTAAVITTQ